MNSKKFLVMTFAFICMIWISGCTDDAGSGKILQRIEYQESALPYGPFNRTVIDLESEKITYEYSKTRREIGDKGSIRYDFTLKEVQEIKKKIGTFNGVKWEKRYRNRWILDGCGWELKLFYTDGWSRKITGFNAWPNDFDRLCVRDIYNRIESVQYAKQKAKTSENHTDKEIKNKNK